MANPLNPLNPLSSDDEGDDEEELGFQDMDPELRRAFVKLVAVINLGVLGAALGALFLAFRANVVAAAVLGIPGVALLAYAAYEYRRVTARRDARKDE